MPESILPDQFAADHLRKTLPTIEDSLFTMTNGIIRDAGDRDWNLIIGDDTNGRLPTYFVRKALARARDERIPTMFVNASNAMRAKLDTGDYIEYFQSRLDPLKTYRPLIITESVGTGTALTALKDAIEESVVCESIDAAAVAAKPNDLEFLRYIGSEDKADLLDVFFCLEAIAGTSLKARALTRMRAMIPQSIKDRIPQTFHKVGRPNVDANVLTGLYTPTYPIRPVSHSDRHHSIGVSYGEVDRILDAYTAFYDDTNIATASTTSVIIKEDETIQS